VAVIFDLDGVLIDSEQVWDEVRHHYVLERGGRWHAGAQRDMMGMSSTEWSGYVRDELGVDRSPEQISAEIAAGVLARYRTQLPLEPHARETVEQLAAHWPLGLASSSNREVIDLVLAVAGLASHFRATVSSEEVGSGKPAPDVYLETARRLEADPAASVAVEDSHNGLLSAAAAGMRVIAVPNRVFPPGQEALGKATLILQSLRELTPAAVESLVSDR
jgi:HAD superfamily hydrolase (TIGR01509 family)